MAALRPTSLLFTHSKLPTVVDEQSAATVQPDEQAQGQRQQRAQQQRAASKLVLLSPTLDSEAAFPAQLSSLVAEHHLPITHHAVQLTYALHSLDEVLTAVLPAGVPPPSSFETVGHLAHVNLLPCHLPYRRLIGAAIVSHSPAIRCVVNKLSAISNEYRVLPMEVIAGDEADTRVLVKEHGCQFRFDYRLVYWNSRLATEHRRLVELIQPHDTVVDIFAGIGPFVISAAKRAQQSAQADGEAGREEKQQPCHILANDKNVHSFDALNDNVALNGVSGRLRTYNMDAREFVADVKQQLAEQRLPRVDHVIMNLPATAIAFLDCLRGLYPHRAQPMAAGVETEEPPCPVVHVYSFSNADDKVADVMSRIEAAIQHSLPPPAVTSDMKGSGGRSGTGSRAVTRAAEAVAETTAHSGAWSTAASERKRKREEKQQAAQCRSQPASWERPLVHFVRNVAPNKDMLCVSFRLPHSVAYGVAPAAATDAIQ